MSEVCIYLSDKVNYGQANPHPQIASGRTNQRRSSLKGKLDLVKIMQGEGFLPEDVNFAIHSERIGQLGITTKVNGAGGKALSLEELYQQYIGTVVMIAGEKGQ